MDTTELSTLIKTRRSIRVFQDKAVPEALLLQAVETATWAPNGGNAQNWRFFIILDKKIINSVEDVIRTGLKTIQSWPEMANAGPAGGRPRNPQPGSPLTTAPALIVVCAVRSSNPMVNAMTKRAETDPAAKEMLEGLRLISGSVQSTSAAAAYLMLVLHQMGLGTLCMTGPLHAKADIEKLLKIPAGMDIVTLVPVGYPAESPTRDRKPVSEVCQVIK
jgi:nitroreductase